jgi:hypothetical protein
MAWPPPTLARMNQPPSGRRAMAGSGVAPSFLGRTVHRAGLETHLAGIAHQVQFARRGAGVAVAMPQRLVVGRLLEQLGQEGEAGEAGIGRRGRLISAGRGGAGSVVVHASPTMTVGRGSLCHGSFPCEVRKPDVNGSSEDVPSLRDKIY